MAWSHGGRVVAGVAWFAGCGGKADTGPPPVVLPTVSDLTEVVPAAMPDEVETAQSNAALDVTVHNGRVFLAFRSAPSYFAGNETSIWIVSSEDELTWRFEGEVYVGSDLREPQLVSWNGTLFLYFAVLGTSPTAYEPQGTRWIQYVSSNAWTEITNYGDPTIVPWKMKIERDVLYWSAYTNGGVIFDPEIGEVAQVHLMTSTDAIQWEPASVAQPVVMEGGASEMDFVVQEDGSLIAVMRNEAGIDGQFGSLVCKAVDGPTQASPWDCVFDKRRFDSPTMFQNSGKIYLIARRNLTDDGFYDLGLSDMDPTEIFDAYEAEYWAAGKRCSLWTVDPESLEVDLVIDLPSKGDTCHTEVLPLDATRYAVYNYSSDPDGPEISWSDGQTGETRIYRQILTVPAF